MIITTDTTPIKMKIDTVIQGSGASEYASLPDKPKINGVTLLGDKNLDDLKITPAINKQVETYVNAHKDELKGEKGERGEKGEKGDTGIGEKGDRGEPGPAGKDGLPGVPGSSGAPGDSAYTIAVNHGFVGSEVEWLESLKGKDGQNGENGYTPQKGIDYFDGTNGIDGQDGKDGFSPSVSLLDTDEGAIISVSDKSGTKSVIIFDGTDGRDGAKGDKGDTGSSGVYIGENEPTDPNINVWIKPNGTPDEFISKSEVERMINEAIWGALNGEY